MHKDLDAAAAADPLTSEEIKKVLARPSDFGYFGDKDMFETWTIGPTIEHRDSEIIDQSNAAAVVKMLESRPELADDWQITDASHWAVGWVHHLSYRVVDADGQATKVANLLKVWFGYLRNEYPIADGDDFSERESNAEWEGMFQAVKHDLRDRELKEGITVEDAAGKALSWLGDLGRVENTDGRGYYPGRTDLIEALEALDLLAPEETEEEQPQA